MAGRRQQVLGWIAVAASTAFAGLWAFWGIVENFHEGWYDASPWRNLGMLLAQYLLPALSFIAAALVAIRWPRVGGGLHGAAALGVLWFFRGSAPLVLIPFLAGPLALMGAAYALGRPRPRRWAVACVVLVPLVTLIASGVGPALRVAGRLDDGNRAARRIAADGVDLVWAPQGPGWPADGVSWEEAVERCAHLSADGLRLEAEPQDVWRLPTADEAVRSMHRHGRSAGGMWDAAAARATYEVMPDKESPLWDVRSKVIYWWTASEASAEEAFIVVYDGQVRRRPKHARWGYLGFRAVKDAAGADGAR
jgi:hypothetical protein